MHLSNNIQIDAQLMFRNMYSRDILLASRIRMWAAERMLSESMPIHSANHSFKCAFAALPISIIFKRIPPVEHTDAQNQHESPNEKKTYLNILHKFMPNDKL